MCRGPARRMDEKCRLKNTNVGEAMSCPMASQAYNSLERFKVIASAEELFDQIDGTGRNAPPVPFAIGSTAGLDEVLGQS